MLRSRTFNEVNREMGYGPLDIRSPREVGTWTTTREKKGFDCVKTTREIRDRLSVELAGMSPEDRVQWLNSRVSRTRSCAASSTGCGHRKGERASPLRRARPAAPCPDAIPSAARQEANDDDHGGLTAYREARKEDGVIDPRLQARVDHSDPCRTAQPPGQPCGAFPG